jgi:uncharacterized protein
MLEKTFCHIKGITAAFEKNLWDQGIKHWDSFLSEMDSLENISSEKKATIKDELLTSKQALIDNNLQYFKAALPPKEHWRLANRGKVAFVDIETTGLSKWTNEITLLGIYDGEESHIFINGENLPQAKEKLKEFDIIVTFNGKQFDLPFIEQYFSHSYDFIHLDLRYMLKELGYKGGLKLIEKQIGITRGDNLKDIDGFEAINLWRRYKRGNQQALDTLVEYNKQDIENLKTLLEHYLENKEKLILA